MNRDTKEKKISDNTFVIKSYATAQETNNIQQVYFKGQKVDIVGEKPTLNDVNTNVQFDVENEMIKQLVVSMNDKTEGIVEACLELPNDQWNELIEYIDSLIAKKKVK